MKFKCRVWNTFRVLLKSRHCDYSTGYSIEILVNSYKIFSGEKFAFILSHSRRNSPSGKHRTERAHTHAHTHLIYEYIIYLFVQPSYTASATGYVRRVYPISLLCKCVQRSQYLWICTYGREKAVSQMALTRITIFVSHTQFYFVLEMMEAETENRKKEKKKQQSACTSIGIYIVVTERNGIQRVRQGTRYISARCSYMVGRRSRRSRNEKSYTFIKYTLKTYIVARRTVSYAQTPNTFTIYE